MRKTKIVCTIGPASENEEVLRKLMLAGMNVARINFSHGNFEEQKSKIETIKKLREELKLPIALLLDTKGPEIRIGKFENDRIYLNEGDIFALTHDEILGNKQEFSVSYGDLYKEVQTGNRILIDDGLVETEVIDIKDEKIYCKVLNEGEISNRKSINVPNVKLNLPVMTENDKENIVKGIDAGFDYIAASFVRKAQDVIEIRNLLKEYGGNRIKIISKIENQEGVDNFDEILAVSDGIMVARGDLSVEIPMDEVPVIQKEFIKKCDNSAKIVITATQMLNSMIENPRPTRAEVSDVSNAIYDVSSGIMLSGETANGKYPVECVEIMDRIAKTTEKSIDYWKKFSHRDYDLKNKEFRFNIYKGICDSAMSLNARAIVTYTESGSTPRIISSFTPMCPIYAITDYKTVWRQLNLQWNVYPILVNSQDSVNYMIQNGIEILKEQNKLAEGDIVLIAGGADALPNMEGSINKVIGGIIRI